MTARIVGRCELNTRDGKITAMGEKDQGKMGQITGEKRRIGEVMGKNGGKLWAKMEGSCGQR